MKHTFLSGESPPNDTESFICVATEDLAFIVLKKTTDKNEWTIINKVLNAHTRDITQILILSDFCTRLVFVSLGLDGLIKMYSDEGEEKTNTYANGMILNGCIMPSL